MDTKTLHNFIFGNATDVGKVRQANEDYYGNFDSPNGFIFLVCDGMGGHVGGAIASQLAVQTIRDCLTKQTFPSPSEALNTALLMANSTILAYAEDHPELNGMGTTCVIILIKNDDVYYAHVGDSRIYILSKKKIHRLTKDHSFIQNMVDKGILTEEEAEKHPRKNEITNALGLKSMLPPTICSEPILVTKGDIIVLCSDGLTGMVSDAAIEEVLLTDGIPLQSKATLLIEKSLENGGLDNVTLQLVEFSRSSYKESRIPDVFPQVGVKKRNKLSKSWQISTIAFLVLIVVGIYIYFVKYNSTTNDGRSVFPHLRDSVINNSLNPKNDSIVLPPSMRQSVDSTTKNDTLLKKNDKVINKENKSNTSSKKDTIHRK